MSLQDIHIWGQHSYSERGNTGSAQRCPKNPCTAFPCGRAFPKLQQWTSQDPSLLMWVLCCTVFHSLIAHYFPAGPVLQVRGKVSESCQHSERTAAGTRLPQPLSTLIGVWWMSRRTEGIGRTLILHLFPPEHFLVYFNEQMWPMQTLFFQH